MDKIIRILSDPNILPTHFGLAIVLSWLSVLIVQFAYRKDLYSLFLEKESLIKIRVALIIFSLVVVGKKILENEITNICDVFSKKYLLFLFIPVVYEILFWAYKYFTAKKVNTKKNEFKKILINQLYSRYDTESGGFFIYPNSQTPKLWAASQSIYGLLESNASDNIDYSKFIKHCKAQKQSQQNYIFKRENNGYFKVVSNLWTVLALNKIIHKIPKDELRDSNFNTCRVMINQSIANLLSLKLSNNGWAPSSDKSNPQSYRLHPTILALWFLSEVILNIEKLKISKETTNEIINTINISLYIIIENYKKSSQWWSNAPYEESGKNIGNNSLTIYVFSILAIIKNNLNNQEYSNKTTLNKFLKKQHNVLMRKVDNCLIRSVEDNETDGPYDNAVNFKSETLSITFYDWIAITIFAMNVSKQNGTYRKTDSIREKRIYNILKQNKDEIKNWYTYRLALMLIGFSFDE